MKKLFSTFLSLFVAMICCAQNEVKINVTDAGTLGSLLGDKKMEISSLTVTGKINSDDVSVMRMMSGAMLRNIDLKNADLVAGGQPFHTDYDGIQWSTEDNKIPGHMFEECPIETIVLPESATEIGDWAFASNHDLKNVVFGGSLKKIAPYAFYYCQGLTDVELSDYIETIGDDAFANCNGIENIHFPLNLKEIGMMCFMGCQKIKEIILPEGMLSVGMAGFFNCLAAKKLVLPASLSDIQSKAFTNCSALEEIYEYAVNIPTFGSSAFSGVDGNLCTVYVPEGMADEYSECDAFRNFANIEEFDTTKRDITVNVSKPGTLASLLGEQAMKTIEKITIKGTINNDDLITLAGMAHGEDYVTEEREYHLSYIDMKDAVIVAGGEPTCCDGGVYEGADNTLTGYTFFFSNGLEEIILPETLEYIAEGAFYYAQNLKNITLFGNVKSFGDFSFYAAGIGKINIPEGIETIGMSTFNSCKNLVEVKLPSTLTAIKDMAFMNCDMLEEIRIPEGIKTFGMAAFFSADNLKRIWLPSTLIDMGNKTFGTDVNVEEVHIAATVPPVWGTCPFGYIFESCKLYVPVGCIDAYKEIMDDEGNGWGEFQTILEENGDKPSEIDNPVLSNGIYYNLSNSDMSAVVTYNDADFIKGQCTAEYEIEKIVVPSTVTYNDKVYTVKGIGRDAFRFNKVLKEIELPETIDSIGESAFKLCNYLEKVIIPANVKEIGRHAFFSCESLKEVNLPVNATRIDEGAFAYCSVLKSVTFPETIENISDNMFMCCTSLTDVKLHDGIKTVGNYAFSECSVLEHLVLPESVEIIGMGAFESCWKLQEIIIPSKVKDIEPSAFMYCKAVTSLVIPESVEKIGDYAFTNCKALNDVTIGSNVEYIGRNVFEACPIENLKFEDGTKTCLIEDNLSIDDGEIHAFEEIALKNIYFGRNVENFKGWYKDNVETITFGSQMTTWQDDYCGDYAEKIIALMTDPTQMVPNFTEDLYQNAVLVVPAGLADKYAAAEGWNKFVNIMDENGVATGIEAIVSDADVEGYYDINGIRINNLVKGLNIVKMKNGETRKIFVK